MECQHDPSLQWPRGRLYAFRFAFVVVVLATIRLAPMFAEYLFFESITRPAGAFFLRLSVPVLDGLMALGGLILGGDSALWRQSPPSYATPAAVVVACYAVGTLAAAAAIALGWTLVDRRRKNYSALARAMRTYTRWLLGLAMMGYALVKVVPTQFGFLTPGDLLRPFGQLSRFDVLWTFMAASPGYTVLTGLVELGGALLLFFPRTALVGGLITGAVLMNVFALDLAYDVRGAAIVAFLLLMLDAIILVPHSSTLMHSLFAQRLEDSRGTAVHRFWSRSRVVAVAVILLVVFARVYDGLTMRRTYYGAGRPIFGLFEVERFERNGQVVTPFASDGRTWKRVGNSGRYDSAWLAVQFANGDFRQFRLQDDVSNQLWTLRDRAEPVAVLRYDRRPDGVIFLSGHIGGDPVKLQLRAVDPRQFPLLTAR